MSQLSIRFCNFVNVDMFRRGLYRVRVRAYLAKRENRRVRIDYDSLTDDTVSTTVARAFAVGSAFEIKYERDEIALDDVFLFRTNMHADSLMLPDDRVVFIKFYLDHTEKEPYEIESMKCVEKFRLEIPMKQQLLTHARIDFSGLFHSRLSIFVSMFQEAEGARTTQGSLLLKEYLDCVPAAIPSNQCETDVDMLCQVFPLESDLWLYITRLTGLLTDTFMRDSEQLWLRSQFEKLSESNLVSTNLDAMRPLGEYTVSASFPDSCDFESPRFHVLRELGTSSKPPFQEGAHLYVFVHGLDGSFADFRKYRNLLILHSNSAHETHLYLLAKSNTGRFDDISEMAKRLDQEIREFIKDKRISKVTFVAHSLGGLIVRKLITLPDFEYLDRLETFVTLACPHFGFLYSTNQFLLNFMQVASAVKNSTAIRQLLCNSGVTGGEADDFIYNLSKSPQMNKFRHIWIVGSEEDAYVPFHSAMLELDSKAISDPTSGNMYIEMLTNLVEGLRKNGAGPSVIRIAVSWPTSTTATSSNASLAEMAYSTVTGSVDRYIGRSAHVNFLLSTQFIEALLQIIPH